MAQKGLDLSYKSVYEGEDIAADPTRTDIERETVLYLADSAREWVFHVFNVPMMRRMLDCSDILIDPEGIELMDGVVVSIKGRFPVSMLSIKKARKSLSFGDMVSTAITDKGIVPKEDGERAQRLQRYREQHQGETKADATCPQQVHRGKSNG